MNNTKINKVIFGLGILAILTLGVITLPREANADTAGRVTPYGSTRFINVRSDDGEYNGYQGPTTPAYQTPAYNNNTSNNNQNRNSNTTSNQSNVSNEDNTDEESTLSPENLKGITANAIFGTNTLMPSGLIQWVLFAIFILVAVILVRKVTGAEARYHAEPLKHA